MILISRWHAKPGTFAGASRRLTGQPFIRRPAFGAKIVGPGLVVRVLEEVDALHIAPGYRAFLDVAPHGHMQPRVELVASAGWKPHLAGIAGLQLLAPTQRHVRLRFWNLMTGSNACSTLPTAPVLPA